VRAASSSSRLLMPAAAGSAWITSSKPCGGGGRRERRVSTERGVGFFGGVGGVVLCLETHRAAQQHCSWRLIMPAAAGRACMTSSKPCRGGGERRASTERGAGCQGCRQES
jgi:hypothetical protein